MKNTMKALSVTLAILAVVTCLAIVPLTDGEDAVAQTGDVSGIFQYGDGTEENPYTITNLEQLEAFRNSVNEGHTYQSEYVQIASGTAPIILPSGWVPIGDSARVDEVVETTTSYFAGSFDGNGCYIVGLSNVGYDPENTDNGEYLYGFFGMTYGAIIHDVKLEEVSITPIKGYVGDSIGGLVGYGLGILDVNNVTVDGIIEGSDAIAGIVGRFYGTDLTMGLCINHAQVTSTAENSKAGGMTSIVSDNIQNTVLTQCENYGSISSYNAGGLIGYNGGSGSCNLAIHDSVNRGPVSGIRVSGNQGGYAGGMVGYDATKADATVTVEGFLNEGVITATNAAGGTIGLNQTSATITQANNAGNILGDNAGGVIGSNGAVTEIRDCRIYGTQVIQGAEHAGGIVGVSNQAIEIFNCDFESGGVITIEATEPGSNVKGIGHLNGAVIGAIHGNDLIIESTDDFDSYRLIAAIEPTASVYDVTLRFCETTNMMTWRVGNAYGPNIILESSNIAGIESFGNNFTITADEDSYIGVLRGGAVESAGFLDEVEYGDTTAGKITVGPNTSLRVGQFEALTTTSQEGYGWICNGIIAGTDGTSVIVVEDEHMNTMPYVWNGTGWDEPKLDVLGSGYHTFQEAFLHDDNYVEITLLDDIVIPATEQTTIIDDKQVVIILNGHTVTVEPGYTGYVFHNYGSLTFQGAFDSEYIGTVDASGATGVYGVLYNEGTLNIYGGTFISDGTAALINNQNGATMVSGGSLQGESALIQPGGGTVVIDSGTFTLPSSNTTDPIGIGSGEVLIAGGTFVNCNDDDIKEHLAPGCEVSDGIVMSGVPSGAVASVGNLYYTDFCDALELAQNEHTLYLVDNVTIDQAVTISGNVTIDLAGYTLTVGEGGSLTITGYVQTISNPVGEVVDPEAGEIVTTGSGLIVIQGGILNNDVDIRLETAEAANPVIITYIGDGTQGDISDYTSQLNLRGEFTISSNVPGTTAVYIEPSEDTNAAYNVDVVFGCVFGENIAVPVAVDSGITATEGNIPRIDFHEGWSSSQKLTIETDGYARWFMMAGDFINDAELKVMSGELEIYGGTWPLDFPNLSDYIADNMILVELDGHYELQPGILITFKGYGVDGQSIVIPVGQSVTSSGTQLPAGLEGEGGVYTVHLYEGDDNHQAGIEWNPDTVYDHGRVEIIAERVYVSSITMSPDQPYVGDTVELSMEFPMGEGFRAEYMWFTQNMSGNAEHLGNESTITVYESGTYYAEAEIFAADSEWVGRAYASVEVYFEDIPTHKVIIHYPEVFDMDSIEMDVEDGETINKAIITVPEGYVFNGFDNAAGDEPVTQDLTLNARFLFTAPSLGYSTTDNMDGSMTVEITSNHVLDSIGLIYQYMIVEHDDMVAGIFPGPSESNVFVISEPGTYTLAVYIIHPEDGSIFGEAVDMDELVVAFQEAPAVGVGYTVEYGPDQATVTADEGYCLSDADENGATIHVEPEGSFRVQVDSEGDVFMSPPTAAQLDGRPVTPETVEFDVSLREIAVTTAGVEIRLTDGEWGTSITGLEPGTGYTVEYRLTAVPESAFAGDIRSTAVTTTALPAPDAPDVGDGYNVTIGEDTAQVTPAEGYEITLDTASPGTGAITVEPNQTFYVRIMANEMQTASEWTGNVIAKPAAPTDPEYSVTTDSVIAGPGLQMKLLNNEIWMENWVNSVDELRPGTDYTVKFRVAATQTAFAGDESAEFIVTTESKPSAGLPTPDAPIQFAGYYGKFTADEAMISAQDGYQLSYDGKSTSVTDITIEPGQEFYVRVAATDTANASAWTRNVVDRPVTTEDVTIEATPTSIVVSRENIEFRVDGGDWTIEAVSGLVPETTYTVEFRFSSDRTSFAGTTVSKEVTTPALYEPEAPPEGYGYTVTFGDDTAVVTPSELFEISIDGTEVVESLTLGPGGAFKVRVAAGGDYTHSTWTDVTLPERPQAPSNPDITAGRTSVSVSDTGIEIRIGDGEWTTSVTGLSSGTSYTVQYRLVATETSFAGVTGEITVRTTVPSGGGGGGTTPTPDPEPEEDSETVTNPDGSSTTTTTRPDGSSTVTTERPDGSSTTTDTKPVEGGTQTTVTDTDSEGNTTSTTTTETETTTSTGSTVSSTTVETTDADGNTTSTTESTYTSEDESTVTQVTVSTDAEGNTTARTSTTLTVSPSDQGTATVSANAIAEAVSQINHATADADETSKVITVQPDGDTAQNVQVVVEPEAMQHIADSGADLEISGDVGTIRASPEVATSLSERTSAVTMSISLADKSQMAPVIQNIVGDRPTYQLTASSGDDSIHELGGEVTVTIPYTLSEGEDPESIVVFYVDDDGILHAMPTTYENGVVSFTTDHFSYYTIQSEVATPEPEPSDDGGDDNTVFYIAAAIVAIVVVAAIAIAVRHKA